MRADVGLVTQSGFVKVRCTFCSLVKPHPLDCAAGGPLRFAARGMLRRGRPRATGGLARLYPRPG